MQESSASYRAEESSPGGDRAAAPAEGQPQATARARLAWALLVLCVLLGVALFLRYGDSILPLIREAG